jgi:hypothetical protein
VVSELTAISVNAKWSSYSCFNENVCIRIWQANTHMYVLFNGVLLSLTQPVFLSYYATGYTESRETSKNLLVNMASLVTSNRICMCKTDAETQRGWFRFCWQQKKPICESDGKGSYQARQEMIMLLVIVVTFFIQIHTTENNLSLEDPTGGPTMHNF